MPPRKTTDFHDRYMPEPMSGCWLWTDTLVGGSRLNGRYGFWSSLEGDEKTAHRHSWKIHNGPIPEGAWVLHKCDVPSCVNPDHLYLGKPKDNTIDICRRGRPGLAKLKQSDIPKIRQLLADGVPQPEIAGMFDIHPSNVSRIKCGRTWRHV